MLKYFMFHLHRRTFDPLCPWRFRGEQFSLIMSLFPANYSPSYVAINLRLILFTINLYKEANYRNQLINQHVLGCGRTQNNSEVADYTPVPGIRIKLCPWSQEANTTSIWKLIAVFHIWTISQSLYFIII